MIKFFRRIRFDLMEKNKTGKYLKYAIGEIILVVIGILIAIQLNEWRNDSINTKQKQKVLLALKSEFEANLTQLDTVYYYQTNTLTVHYTIFHILFFLLGGGGATGPSGTIIYAGVEQPLNDGKAHAIMQKCHKQGKHFECRGPLVFVVVSILGILA